MLLINGVRPFLICCESYDLLGLVTDEGLQLALRLDLAAVTAGAKVG